MSKHTKGQWLEKDGQVYIEETGKTIAVIPYWDNLDEQRANARLIASATELLSAAKALLARESELTTGHAYIE
jgi:hypothetical protein